MAQWQPLASYLQSTLGQRVELTVYDLNELEAAVAENAVDVVFTTSGHFIALKHRYGLSAPLATQITRADGHDLSAFGGVIFTRAENAAINRLADLVGQAHGHCGAWISPVATRCRPSRCWKPACRCRLRHPVAS